MGCDAVVELDSTFHLTNHAPALCNMLLLDSGLNAPTERTIDPTPARRWMRNFWLFRALTGAQASVGTPISSILGLFQFSKAFPLVGTFNMREEAGSCEQTWSTFCWSL